MKKKLKIAGIVFLALLNIVTFYFMFGTGAYKTWNSYEVLTSSDLNAQFLLAQLKTAMNDSIDAWWTRNTDLVDSTKIAAGAMSVTDIGNGGNGFLTKPTLADSLANNYGIQENGIAWIDSTQLKNGGVSGSDIVNPFRYAYKMYLTGSVSTGDMIVMGTIIIPEVPSVNQTATGKIISGTAGETLVFGNLVRKNSSGTYSKTDADSLITMSADGMAIAAIASGQAGSILINGYVRNDSWNFTQGAIIYASTSTGAITSTAVSGAGDQLQQVGKAVRSNIIQFTPEKTVVEIQ